MTDYRISLIVPEDKVRTVWEVLNGVGVNLKVESVGDRPRVGATRRAPIPKLRTTTPFMPKPKRPAPPISRTPLAQLILRALNAHEDQSWYNVGHLEQVLVENDYSKASLPVTLARMVREGTVVKASGGGFWRAKET